MISGSASAVMALNPVVLVGAALLAGNGQGPGQLGSLTLIGLHVASERRAEANAVLNLGGYVPAGLLPIATGIIIDQTGLATGATCFAVVLAAVVFAGAVVSRSASGEK